jgi:hypothetical protein
MSLSLSCARARSAANTPLLLLVVLVLLVLLVLLPLIKEAIQIA